MRGESHQKLLLKVGRKSLNRASHATNAVVYHRGSLHFAAVRQRTSIGCGDDFTTGMYRAVFSAFLPRAWMCWTHPSKQNSQSPREKLAESYSKADVNNRRVTDLEARRTSADLAIGSVMVLCSGKEHYTLLRFVR